MTPAIASALMPLMRGMDAETAHGIALRALALGLAGRDAGADHPSLATEVAGLRLRTPTAADFRHYRRTRCNRHQRRQDANHNLPDYCGAGKAMAKGVFAADQRRQAVGR